jgi:uncharacterized tellurite resistance protein B-like protein
MAKRVSISTAQAQEGAAAELVSLLQTVTADGKISNDEIKALHRWTRDNKDCGLPGMQILEETIESICADGRVSSEEREELAKVIERVLPPELREVAKQRRRLENLAQKERTRAESHAAAAEAERRAPVFDFDFLVAGVAYENRALVTARMTDHQPVFIIRDRRNQFSPNAIEVRTADGFQIGFVPEKDAVDLAPLLDQGYRHTAWVKKMWQGRSIPIPVVIAEIYRPDTAKSESVREDEVPPKRTPSFVPPPPPPGPTSARRGCVIPLALTVGSALLVGCGAAALL